jgi:hypothetical protein
VFEVAAAIHVSHGSPGAARCDGAELLFIRSTEMPFPFHKILFVVLSFESREFDVTVGYPCQDLVVSAMAAKRPHQATLISWIPCLLLGVAHSLYFIPPLTALVQRQLIMLPVMGILRVSLAT